MENKINLVELLKDCPKGMELYSPLFDDVKFEDCTGDYIYIRLNYGVLFALTKYGTCKDFKHSKCVIFPQGKTTWEGFVPPCKFKDGDILVHTQNDRFVMSVYHKRITDYIIKTHCVLWDRDEGLSVNKEICCYNDYVRLATEEEKQKLFHAIKENGYEWNVETKTLAKLIVPRFKVGDRVRRRDGYVVEITEFDGEEEVYVYESKVGGIGCILFSEQDDWELVPNKFDITTLKPFDKVLVKYGNVTDWKADLYSHYDEGMPNSPFCCIGAWYEMCIPYEGNEHLLGTDEDCDEYYKTWK